MTKAPEDSTALWNRLLNEINTATAAMMYLLRGVELVRNTDTVDYHGLPASQREFVGRSPKLSYVDVPMVQTGRKHGRNEFLARGGFVEQIAFKGWVEQIYHCVWDSDIRNRLKAATSAPNAIRPEGDVIGDFGRIRNDLIHHRGIATKRNSGKCQVLKWFEPGDPMVLGMGHVFDFLNHMGMMTTYPGIAEDGSAAGWMPFPEMEDQFNFSPAPRIVSLRTFYAGELENGSSLYGIGIVFDNGVFANIPLEHPRDDCTFQERGHYIETAQIDTAGNLCLPNGTVIDRTELYQQSVAALCGGGQQIEGIGVPGPWYRIRT